MSSTGDQSPKSISPSTTPNLANQVPKFGTVIPNRIFVGGIATNTTDQELKVFFASYGAVKDTKIICDRAGVSKGYGFVTFETQEDAEKIIKKESDSLIFKERKLNIGPAVRKQQAYPRLLDGVPTAAGTAMFFAPSPYGYPAGLTVIPSAADCQNYAFQQAPPQLANYANTLMIPQPLFMPQHQYSYSTTSQIPVSSQATALQYASQQWASAGCFQPSTGTVTANPVSNYLYPSTMQHEYIYPSATGTTQYLELADGTMLSHEQNLNHEILQHSVATDQPSTRTDSIGELKPSMTTLVSLQNRPIQHSGLSTQSMMAQPPPVKKMTPMPPMGSPMVIPAQRYSSPAFITKSAPLAAKPHPSSQRMFPHLPSYLVSTPKMEEARFKFDDAHLHCNVAPPTPPTTPAAGH